jgi:hypothetical protein
MTTKKQPTRAAQTAALIRAELKNHGIVARVTCENHRGGNSVNVTVYDQLPATVQKIKEFTAKFEYGKFNGMEDYYEMSNVRDDIPQVKYLFVRNEFSDALKQQAWDFVRAFWAGLEDAPQSYEAACSYYAQKHRTWGSALVHRELTEDGFFWKKHKPRVKAG